MITKSDRLSHQTVLSRVRRPPGMTVGLGGTGGGQGGHEVELLLFEAEDEAEDKLTK